MASLSWLADHWFDICQTVGITGGLIFTGIALRADTRAKRVQNLFTITQHHRDIWEQLYSRPKLARILEVAPNIASHPVTRDEEFFVRFLILHLYTVYRAIRYDLYLTPDGFAADISAFLSLPVPREIWMKLRTSQDGDFVTFVENAYRDSKNRSTKPH